ncbi:MAG: sugar transferase, partial [Bacteroidota bacterium]
IVLSLMLLPLVAPLILVAWIGTRLGGGQGFFCHERVGRNGRVFRCWKLRTMIPNADRVLAEYLMENAKAAEQWARTQKLDADPRITRFGHVLRRTSLDELPQIWNVICGAMEVLISKF